MTSHLCRPAQTVRDRLIDAAEVVSARQGHPATTVSEVAEVAGVSRGWLYRHFPDKVTLLGAAIVRLNKAYWSEAHAMLERFDGLDRRSPRASCTAAPPTTIPVRC